jgi:hypothetical protein
MYDRHWKLSAVVREVLVQTCVIENPFYSWDSTDITLVTELLLFPVFRPPSLVIRYRGLMIVVGERS